MFMSASDKSGRFVRTAILALITIAGLCGCGGGGTPQPPAPPPPPPAAFHPAIIFISNRALDGSDTFGGAINVWGMNADGSHPTPLTKIGADSILAIFSPDGSKIAVLSFGALDGSSAGFGMGQTNLWVMNDDGSNPRPLTRYFSGVAVQAPVWSPDGTRLAFESNGVLDGSDAPNSGTSNLWVVNLDGSGLHPLTRLTTMFADSHNPAWSPDGTKIAFQSRRALDGSGQVNLNGVVNIWTVNPDGSSATPLTHLTAAGPNFSENPQWSPDGHKILYWSQRPLDGSDTAPSDFANIWVMNPDGSGAIPLTTLTASDALTPAWSPDGTKIAYRSDRQLDGSDGFVNPEPNVWVMNADGSGSVPMTRYRLAFSNFPVWLPNSSQVSFISDGTFDGGDNALPGSNRNIWVAKPDGSSTIPFTRLLNAGSASPDWRH